MSDGKGGWAAQSKSRVLTKQRWFDLHPLVGTTVRRSAQTARSRPPPATHSGPVHTAVNTTGSKSSVLTKQRWLDLHPMVGNTVQMQNILKKFVNF